VRNELLYAKEAAKIIRAFSSKERERLGPQIERLAADPALGKQLTGPLSGLRSLRIGSLRVIYQHFPADRRIIVLTLGLRRDNYKKSRRKK